MHQFSKLKSPAHHPALIKERASDALSSLVICGQCGDDAARTSELVHGGLDPVIGEHG
jgi:hypothetical protein